MNELTTVDQMEKQLKSYADEQLRTIITLKKQNELLTAEVERLKSALALHSSNTVKVEVSLEQATCEQQIARLYERSYTTELNLEETKRLEILTKTLYLAKEKSGQAINADAIPVNVMSPEMLAQIASAPDAQSESD